MHQPLWAEFFVALEEEIAPASALRAELHQFPDPSGAEGPTRERILSALGSPEWVSVAETGGIVRIGPATGPAVLIRAELDALPVIEQTGASFAAVNGFMHACGHDLHQAAAVAVCRAAARSNLPVAIVLVLQPREEVYPSGARDVVESGLLDAHDIRHALGIHVHPGVEFGAIATGKGVVNAAADEFQITLRGPGGHAAYPQHSADPIVALAEIVMSAQTLISRRVDPMRPAVLTFGTVQSGSAANVIPTRANASGSIRTMSVEDRELVHRELEALAERIAGIHGCTADTVVTMGEPMLENDGELVEVTEEVLRRGGIAVVAPMRSCGADDFSYFSERYPSLMMFLGVHVGVRGPALHSAEFLPPERSLGDAVRALGSAFVAASDLIGERTSQ